MHVYVWICVCVCECGTLDCVMFGALDDVLAPLGPEKGFHVRYTRILAAVSRATASWKNFAYSYMSTCVCVSID